MSSDKLSLFRAARFSYMIGKPIMSDNDYEVLLSEIKQDYPDTPELHQIYEKDSINISELVLHGVKLENIQEYLSKKVGDRNYKYKESYDLLDLDNKSIVSYREEQEEYSALAELGNGTFICSPKIDGIFTSAIYEREHDSVFTFASSQSRGGSSNSVDTTKNGMYLFPKEITIDGVTSNSVKLNFEIVMDKEACNNLGYTNQRSGAQGLMMSTVNTKTHLIHNLKYFCHGISGFDSKLEEYNAMIKTGINSVPTEIYTVENKYDIQKLIELSKSFVKEWSESKGIDVDGVVVKKDDSSIVGEAIKGTKLYDSDVLALKSGFWEQSDYIATVTEITASQEDSEISYAINFEPIVVFNGNKMTKVTNIRLATLMADNIREGSKIIVTYVNNTTPKYVGKAE